MNYIDLLNQEEKTILCGIITGRDFKELFKRNEQDFSKIRKGFRAKSLTEQQALSIAIVNVDKPFIALWVNMRVDLWLKEIQENIEELERDDVAVITEILKQRYSDKLSDADDRKKTANALLRRGFAYADIKKAISIVNS